MEELVKPSVFAPSDESRLLGWWDKVGVASVRLSPASELSCSGAAGAHPPSARQSRQPARAERTRIEAIFFMMPPRVGRCWKSPEKGPFL